MGFYGGSPGIAKANRSIEELNTEIKNLRKESKIMFFIGLGVGSVVTIIVALYI